MGKEESSATFRAVNKSGTYDPVADQPGPDGSGRIGCWIALCIGTLIVVAGMSPDWKLKWNWFSFVGIGTLMLGVALGVGSLLRRNK